MRATTPCGRDSSSPSRARGRAPMHRPVSWTDPSRSGCSWRNMPSRRPRSATRSIGWATSEQMAAKMAQPASIRSARSGPMLPISARASISMPDHAVHHRQHMRGLVPAAIHPGAVVARQLERDGRQGGDRAGGAQQMIMLRLSKSGAVPCAKGERRRADRCNMRSKPARLLAAAP